MKVFTTGQVAKICKVAPRTVSKWFDSGRLKGYRIPGSQDRRIPREYLLKFMRDHGIPTGDLDEDGKLLLVTQDRALIEKVRTEFASGMTKVRVASSGFHAGGEAFSFRPHCVLVDVSINPIDAIRLCTAIRQHPKFAATYLVIVIPDSCNVAIPSIELSEKFKRPFDVELLCERLKTLVQQQVDVVA